MRVLDRAVNDSGPKKARVNFEVEQENKKYDNGEQEAAQDESSSL